MAIPRQGSLPWLTPAGVTYKAFADRQINQSKLKRAVVRHKGLLYPVTNLEANELMRRYICVVKYQIEDTLYLENTEPEWVRPLCPTLTEGENDGR